MKEYLADLKDRKVLAEELPVIETMKMRGATMTASIHLGFILNYL